MRNLSNNLKLAVVLALTLFAIVLIQSILEYNSSRQAVMDLLNNQASSLLLSVARASEKGLVAYEIQQDKIAQHLYAVAEMENRLDKIGALDESEMKRAVDENALLFLHLLDPAGSIIMSVDSDATGSRSDFRLDSALIAPLLSGRLARMNLGFIDLQGGGRKSFAVAIGRDRGGAVALGIDATELLTLRRTFGAGSVIDDLSQSPGVRYAAIMRSGILMAASRNFPNDSMDGWYLPDTSAQADTRTRIRKFGQDTDIFEAAGLFTVAGQPYGEIVVGMDTGYLGLLTAKLRRDIVWRSLLFLVIAVAALTGVIWRQNNRLLSIRLNQMQKDVMRLETDRTLNAKMAAMGELAGGVAHEIRNPLNAIGVIIQRLQREFEPRKDEAEYKELTCLIKRETDRINNSIEHFLTLARPPVLHRSKTDINSCIKKVAALFQTRAEARGCVLHLDLAEIPTLSLDADLVHQALLNLLENALAAVGNDGAIGMRTSRAGKSCYVDISDNGPGIPDNRKARVFDLYYTTKPTGTGMGLPTVLRIVKEHGGRVELMDGPLGGAIFRLELPVE